MFRRSSTNPDLPAIATSVQRAFGGKSDDETAEDDPPLLRMTLSNPSTRTDLGILEVRRTDNRGGYGARLVANTPDDVVIRQRPFDQDTVTTNPWALLVAAIAAIIPDTEPDEAHMPWEPDDGPEPLP